MNNKLVFRVPGKGRTAVYLLLGWVMVMLWLRDVLKLPSAITYLTDIMVVYLIVTRINKIIRENKMVKTNVQSGIFAAIIIAILIGVILNLVSPLLVAWAARNNIRFFVFFFICVGVLKSEDIDRIFRMLVFFFWINIVICTYQYYGEGLQGDNLGGLFGTEKGCNAYMNILLCAVISIIFGKFCNKEKNFFQLVLYLVASIYIALLAELKAFYVEIALILLLTMIANGVSWRWLVFLVIGLLGTQILLFVLSVYAPKTMMMLLDKDALEMYLSGKGYTQSNDLNRFTAIQQINQMFFKGKPLRLLFGFGFGNCETSQFSFLQSSFFRQYGYLHYRWFTHAWVFLEQGAVGLILLVTFIVSIIPTTRKRKSLIRKDIYIAGICFIATCVFGMIYNSALQLEAGYIIAFMCSVPFVASKGTPAEDNCSKTEEPATQM